MHGTMSLAAQAIYGNQHTIRAWGAVAALFTNLHYWELQTN